MHAELTPAKDAIPSSSGFTWMDESGIIIAVSSVQELHTKADAVENMKVIADIAGDVPRPCMIDISNVQAMSREARAYYAQKEHATATKAVAMVTRSNMGRLVANFFISLSSPNVPTRVFNDPVSAKEWLTQFIT